MREIRIPGTRMTTTCTGEGRLTPLACNDRGLVYPPSPQPGTSLNGVGQHWHQLSPNSLAWASCASIPCISPGEDPRQERIRSSTWQYAVLSVRIEPCCERVVIAYPDEKSLRDLLAPSSILGLGYCSREEAQLNIDGCTTTACSLRRKVSTTPVTTAISLRRSVANHQPQRGESKLAWAWSILREFVQHSFAITRSVSYLLMSYSLCLEAQAESKRFAVPAPM